MTTTTGPQRQLLAGALYHLQSALDLLDEAGVLGHVGAQIDLAAHQVQREIGSSTAAGLRRARANDDDSLPS